MDLPVSSSQLESLRAALFHIHESFMYNEDSDSFTVPPGSKPLHLSTDQMIDITYIFYCLPKIIDPSAARPYPAPGSKTCLILTHRHVALLSRLIKMSLEIYSLDSDLGDYSNVINKFLYNLHPKELSRLYNLNSFFLKQNIPF